VFATDFLLLLITLVGLLRMRREGGGFLGLGWLLWKQVRGQHLLQIVVPRSANVIFVQEGVIWILIATIADIFPVVRLASLLSRLCSSPLNVLDFSLSESERCVISSTGNSITNNVDFTANIRCIRSGRSFFAEGGRGIFVPHESLTLKI
jgi:hypothetical protein